MPRVKLRVAKNEQGEREIERALEEWAEGVATPWSGVWPWYSNERPLQPRWGNANPSEITHRGDRDSTREVSTVSGWAFPQDWIYSRLWQKGQHKRERPTSYTISNQRLLSEVKRCPLQRQGRKHVDERGTSNRAKAVARTTRELITVIEPPRLHNTQASVHFTKRHKQLPVLQPTLKVPGALPALFHTIQMLF